MEKTNSYNVDAGRRENGGVSISAATAEAASVSEDDYGSFDDDDTSSSESGASPVRRNENRRCRCRIHHRSSDEDQDPNFVPKTKHRRISSARIPSSEVQDLMRDANHIGAILPGYVYVFILCFHMVYVMLMHLLPSSFNTLPPCT